MAVPRSLNPTGRLAHAVLTLACCIGAALTLAAAPPAAPAAAPAKTAPAPAEAAPAVPVEEKLYTLSIAADPNSLHVGDAAKLTVKVQSKPPWSLKTTTPFEATVTGTPGLEVSKSKLTSKDFVDAKAPDKTLLSTFVAKAPGPQSVAVALNFFLCTEQVCQRYKESVELKLDVAAAAAAH